MPPADSSPPAIGTGAVAGVRLADHRLIFVEGVPADLPAGATLLARLAGRELSGTVSIPPALLVWREAAARCAGFVAIISLPTPAAASPPTPPSALFLADHTAPDEEILAAMLALAREETP